MQNTHLSDHLVPTMARTYTRCTNEERLYLAKWYPEMGGDLCAVALDRPVAWVYARARLEGIKYAGMSSPDVDDQMLVWTSQMDALVLTHYATKGSRWCAKQLSCLPAVVRERMLALERSEQPTRRRASQRTRPAQP